MELKVSVTYKGLGILLFCIPMFIIIGRKTTNKGLKHNEMVGNGGVVDQVPMRV